MKLTIKTALTLLTVLLTAVIAIEGGLALRSLGQVNDNVIEIATNWLPSVEITNTLNTNTSDYRIAEGSHIMSTTPDEMAKAEDEIKAVSATIAKNLDVYKSLVSSPDEQANLDKFIARWGDYNALHDKLIELSRANQNEQAATLFKGEMRTVFDDASSVLLKAVNINHDSSEVARVDAEQTFGGARTMVWSTIIVGVLLGLAAIVFVRSRVTAPLGRLSGAIANVAAGDYASSIAGIARHDELGIMARAVDDFRHKLADAEQQRAEQAERDAAAAQRAKDERIAIADDLIDKVGSLADVFLSTSGEVKDAATNLASTAEETARQAQTVAGAAEEASVNVQTVAASAEELSASVHEINNQVSQSSKVADRAYHEAEEVNGRIAVLSSAAAAIGDVVNLISGIAEQTNLLALNATIEAARAGEAGRGFAVVASEVKALAAQTGRATEDISAKITEMQQATDTAVASIAEIVRTIASVRESSAAIAGAVEQQGSATGEIAQNTQLAASGTASVTNNISGVGTAAEMTGSASTQLMGLAGSLTDKAKELKIAVAGFADTLRAA
ncbi:methyl-accepting chemotaxis protein [Pleomorphomonas sp. JP5]|uniref:methyl-accepting chemotaxis protein n=1 Tax=Pleomorphomonas sp. JP5 TaxID=2942998 RepID=UPI002042C16A|nr:methyl-accepting chemotaxis protein [Pleomorphomonas sp. JP5]MCM5557450.1 methyl-accepting chemotaxis protein [Pleomorphomonas sp. JP5]